MQSSTPREDKLKAGMQKLQNFQKKQERLATTDASSPYYNGYVPSTPGSGYVQYTAAAAVSNMDAPPLSPLSFVADAAPFDSSFEQLPPSTIPLSEVPHAYTYEHDNNADGNDINTSVSANLPLSSSQFDVSMGTPSSFSTFSFSQNPSGHPLTPSVPPSVSRGANPHPLAALTTSLSLSPSSPPVLHDEQQQASSLSPPLAIYYPEEEFNDIDDRIQHATASLERQRDPVTSLRLLADLRDEKCKKLEDYVYYLQDHIAQLLEKRPSNTTSADASAPPPSSSASSSISASQWQMAYEEERIKVQEYDSYLKEMTKETGSLKHEKALLQKQLHDLQLQTVQKISEEHAAITAATASLKATLTEEKEHIIQQLHVQTAARDALQMRAEQLQQQIQEQEDDIVALANDAASMEDQLAQYIAERDALRHTLSMLQEQQDMVTSEEHERLLEMDKQYRQLQQAYDHTCHELDAEGESLLALHALHNTTLQDLEREKETHSVQLAEVSQMLRSTESALERADNDMREVQSDFTAMQTDFNSLQEHFIHQKTAFENAERQWDEERMRLQQIFEEEQNKMLREFEQQQQQQNVAIAALPSPMQSDVELDDVPSELRKKTIELEQRLQDREMEYREVLLELEELTNRHLVVENALNVSKDEQSLLQQRLRRFQEETTVAANVAAAAVSLHAFPVNTLQDDSSLGNRTTDGDHVWHQERTRMEKELQLVSSQLAQEVDRYSLLQSKANDLREQYTHLLQHVEHVEEMARQVEPLQKERDYYANRVSIMEQSLLTLSANQKHKHEEEEAEEEESMVYEVTLQEMRLQTEELKEKVAALEDQLREVTESALQQCDQLTLRHQQQMQETREEQRLLLSDARSHAEVWRENCDNASALVLQREKEKAVLLEKIGECDATVSELQTECNTIRSYLVDQQAAMDVQRTTMQASIDDKSKIIAQYQGALHDLQSLFGELEKDFALLQKQQQQLQQQQQHREKEEEQEKKGGRHRGSSDDVALFVAEMDKVRGERDHWTHQWMALNEKREKEMDEYRRVLHDKMRCESEWQRSEEKLLDMKQEREEWKRERVHLKDAQDRLISELDRSQKEALQQQETWRENRETHEKLLADYEHLCSLIGSMAMDGDRLLFSSASMHHPHPVSLATIEETIEAIKTRMTRYIHMLTEIRSMLGGDVDHECVDELVRDYMQLVQREKEDAQSRKPQEAASESGSGDAVQIKLLNRQVRLYKAQCLREAGFRVDLAFQKRFLTLMIGDQRALEQALVVYTHRTRVSLQSRWRSVALAVMALQRMKIACRHWSKVKELKKQVREDQQRNENIFPASRVNMIMELG